METRTISYLADIIGQLKDLSEGTENGFVYDHCASAIRELRNAMRCAMGEDD